jgi:cyclophilin family peptidyl-prolyl cis-trans isomerase
MEAQADRRWIVLVVFAVIAAGIVGGILISRSGGGSSDSTATSSKGSGSNSLVASCKPSGGETGEVSFAKPKEVLKEGESAQATVATSEGTFEIALDTEQAPITANSFAFLAEEGFYDGLNFHRIVPEFVIQGGDPLGNGSGGPGYSCVEKPPANLKYTKGTVAMAKSAGEAAGTSGSQFYIVTGPQGEELPPEYALAGQVDKGLDVVEKIGELAKPGTEEPKKEIVIESITIEHG